MNTLFRSIISIVVFVATYFFIYWLPLSLIPFIHQTPLDWIISLVCAFYASRLVWKNTESAGTGSARYVMTGALIIGAAAFVAGFFGPMIFAPGANQGPLLGLFITGPLGFIAGGIGGYIYSRVKLN